MLDQPIARFAMAGLANTLTGLAVIFGCKSLLRFGDVAANFVGYAAGILLGFLLNKRWTFRHHGHWGTAFARYLVVLAAAYLINLAAVIYLIDGLHLNSYLAQAAGIVPYAFIGYLGSRYFVFTTAKVEK